jgi:hypothetical protein
LHWEADVTVNDLSFSEAPGFFADTGTAASGASAFGPIMMIAGAVNQAIGSFYAAKNAQIQMRMQEQNLLFQQRMSNMAARQAEFRAQGIMEAGQRQIGAYTMQAGAAKSQAKTQLAARGVQAGKGSSAEIMATFDLIKEIDAMTINANTVRAAEAQRMAATRARTQGIMAGASARSYGLSAGAISPGLGAFQSLLGGAADIGIKMQSAELASQRHYEMMRALEETN